MYVAALSPVGFCPDRVALCLCFVLTLLALMLMIFSCDARTIARGEGGGWGRADVWKCPEVSLDTSDPLVACVRAKMLVIIICYLLV